MSGSALLQEGGQFSSGGCGGEAAHEVYECGICLGYETKEMVVSTSFDYEKH